MLPLHVARRSLVAASLLNLAGCALEMHDDGTAVDDALETDGGDLEITVQHADLPLKSPEIGSAGLSAELISYESGVDRPGGDFTHFAVGSAAECRSACVAANGCAAFTFVGAGVQSTAPVCWLKSSIPERTRVSAEIKSGIVRKDGLEYSVDRGGSDYKSVELTSPDPNVCKHLCESEREVCRAFTYVEPGVQGEQAHCWLKNAEPAVSSNEATISGVVPWWCPADKEVTQSGNAGLTPNAVHPLKQLCIARSNITIDCQGAILDGTRFGKDDQGKTVRTDPWAAIQILGSPKNVTIKNCNIRGYQRPVDIGNVNRPFAQQLRAYLANPEGQLNPDLIEGFRQPSDITFDHVNVTDAQRSAYWVRHDVSQVTIKQSVINGPVELGVYLEPGANHIRLIDNSFTTAINGTIREAIAVDSAHDNEILGNTFKSFKVGVSVFKNCGEHMFDPNPEKRQGPRLTHASGNRIVGNRFKNMPSGIKIAARADIAHVNYDPDLKEAEIDDPHQWFCGDDTYLPASTDYRMRSTFVPNDILPDARLYHRAHYRDYAEGTVVRCNLFEGVPSALSVADDDALVEANRFAGSRIVVGSVVRMKKHEPVHGVNVAPNQSESLERLCEDGSTVSGNTWKSGCTPQISQRSDMNDQWGEEDKCDRLGWWCPEP